MSNIQSFVTGESNSHIKASFTLEQVKEAAKSTKFAVIPANASHKCFFTCGELSGCVSQNVEKKLMRGEIPALKVIAVDKPTADEFGGPFKGLQLVEDKQAEGAILL